ncbi:MAG: helix-turn-helix domain-containing protein [bacterium]|nr:helix-turn-helix domain-containing protein [bacterium]
MLTAPGTCPRAKVSGERTSTRTKSALPCSIATVDHRVDSLARKAHMSPRTFARRFREATGTTPMRWLTRERVARAQRLLETTEGDVDRVAEKAGFSSAQVLRLHFRRVVGTSPTGYRRAFRG